MDPGQLREYIVAPTLQAMGLHSPAAEDLVMGTIAQESKFRWIDQRDTANRPGPAYGIVQMERVTHDDVWVRYFDGATHIDRRRKFLSWCVMPLAGPPPTVEVLHFNLRYAVGMCRAKYRLCPGAIPETLEGQAAYWKRWYNTPLGAGTEQAYMANFRAFCIA